MSWSWASSVGCAGVLYVLYLAFGYFRALRSIRYGTGKREALFSGNVLAKLTVDEIPFITSGSYYQWKAKYNDFVKYDADVYSVISFWPRPAIYFDIADPALIKEITAAKHRFPKAVEMYSMLQVFGDNLVTTEGDIYRKHRRVANPAFSEPNNKLVWSESVAIMLDLFDNVWENAPEVNLKHAGDLTTKITLFIISAAGFGRKTNWQNDAIKPEGHKLSFTDALHTALSQVFVYLAVPAWAKSLTNQTRHVYTSYEEFGRYMKEMVGARKSSDGMEQHHDLFNNLLAAADAEKNSLTEEELFGNIFMFLMAGHETTAHALAYAFALLALYPKEQEAFYEQINQALPNRKVPTYDDMPALAPAMNVFYEALRMMPPVASVPKKTTEDRMFVTSNWKGEKREVFIPKGVILNINMTALHNHPRYWDEPETFNPSRFSDPNWPREAFLPFSGGPRGCIGRRFAETESAVILTMLIQRYKLEIKVEPQFANETFEERKRRLMWGKPGITLGPASVPLTLKRRW